MIEGVERLNSELHLEPLGDREALEQGHVKVVKAGSSQQITARRAQCPGGSEYEFGVRVNDYSAGSVSHDVPYYLAAGYRTGSHDGASFRHPVYVRPFPL